MFFPINRCYYYYYFFYFVFSFIQSLVWPLQPQKETIERKVENSRSRSIGEIAPIQSESGIFGKDGWYQTCIVAATDHFTNVFSTHDQLKVHLERFVQKNSRDITSKLDLP